MQAANAENDEKKRKFFAMESTPAHIFMEQKASTKRRFDDSEHSEGPSSKKNKDSEEEGVSNMAGEKAKQWKSFWIPELSTTAEADKVEKPSGKILK